MFDPQDHEIWVAVDPSPNLPEAIVAENIHRPGCRRIVIRFSKPVEPNCFGITCSRHSRPKFFRPSWRSGERFKTLTVSNPDRILGGHPKL